MQFSHLDGSLYYYNVRNRFLTSADISKPETLSKLMSLLPRISIQLSGYSRELSAMHAIVLENFDQKDGPSMYTLDYEKCRYFYLDTSQGVQQGILHRKNNVHTRLNVS